MARDPICGMWVDENSALKVTQKNKVYFFCSPHCRDKFRGKPFYKNKLFIVSTICILLVLFSYPFSFFVPFRKSFLMYLKAIWWAVLLGLFLGGVIDYYIPREYVSKILSRKKPCTIFNAVFLGFLMSACSHGILALSIELHKKGASNPAVVSFLLASPWANFAVTMMLLSLFGLKGLFIVLAALIVAINTGFIFMFLEKKGLIEKNKNVVEVAKDFFIFKDFKTRVKNYRFNLTRLISGTKGVVKGMVELADMVLWWIILGMFIASIASAYIPGHFFHKFMGRTLLGLLVTLGIATLIEVCSEGSSPLSFEIYRQTHALGNSFAFLMAGVATDYTEIGLLWVNVGRHVALWMPLVTLPQVVAIGYLFNLLLK
ncbi:MAG: permease [Candidatus Omnitrophica bacterium]|nr:permease [Candidatus Omnitrophota bacterium]MCM8796212.1 permease [Candidatus Omnitrophota bacterium]